MNLTLPPTRTPKPAPHNPHLRPHPHQVFSCGERSNQGAQLAGHARVHGWVAHDGVLPTAPQSLRAHATHDTQYDTAYTTLT